LGASKQGPKQDIRHRSIPHIVREEKQDVKVVIDNITPKTLWNIHLICIPCLNVQATDIQMKPLGVDTKEKYAFWEIWDV